MQGSVAWCEHTAKPAVGAQTQYFSRHVVTETNRQVLFVSPFVPVTFAVVQAIWIFTRASSLFWQTFQASNVVSFVYQLAEHELVWRSCQFPYRLPIRSRLFPLLSKSLVTLGLGCVFSLSSCISPGHCLLPWCSISTHVSHRTNKRPSFGIYDQHWFGLFLYLKRRYFRFDHFEYLVLSISQKTTTTKQEQKPRQLT